MRQVAAALICDPENRTTLMTLRHPNAKRPSMWEFPGGLVEFLPELGRFETTEEAVERETKEELGRHLVVRVAPALCSVFIPFESGGAVITLHPVTIEGDPAPLAAQVLEYACPKHAIRYLPCVPSTYHFYPWVLKHLRLRDD